MTGRGVVHDAITSARSHRAEPDRRDLGHQLLGEDVERPDRRLQPVEAPGADRGVAPRRAVSIMEMVSALPDFSVVFDLVPGPP